MKIRNGFVSNSSSSSFIVIDGTDDNRKLEGIIYVPSTLGGNYEFGWEVEDFYDIGTRLNWSIIVAQHLLDTTGNDYLPMIREVLKIHGAEDMIIEDVFKQDAYIDHQSVPDDETYENAAMFRDQQALCDFLFSDKSCVHTDNDNR